MNIRDRILGATRRAETVTVPEWDGVTLVVTAWSGRQKEQWGRQRNAAQVAGQPIDPMQIAAELFALCVRDEHGQPVFSEADAAHISELDAGGIERVMAVVTRVNGLGAGDDAQKK